MSEAGLQQITGRHNRVHDRVWKGLLACSRRQVKDDLNVGAGGLAILTRKQISFHNINPLYSGIISEVPCDTCEFASGSTKADQIPKSLIQKVLNHAGTDETAGAGDQYAIVWGNDEVTSARSLRCLKDFLVIHKYARVWSWN